MRPSRSSSETVNAQASHFSIGIQRTDCLTHWLSLKLPEGVLLAGILLGGFTGGFDLIDTHRDAERWIGFLPDLRVCPVLILGSTVNDGVEGGIDLPAFRNVDGFLMHLIADGVGVVSGSSD